MEREGEQSQPGLTVALDLHSTVCVSPGGGAENTPAPLENTPTSRPLFLAYH